MHRIISTLRKGKLLKKNRLASNIVYTKQSDDSLFVVDTANEKFFFKIEGSIACDAFKLIADNKPESVILSTLQKKHPHAPEKDLTRHLKVFIKRLIKERVINTHE